MCSVSIDLHDPVHDVYSPNSITVTFNYNYKLHATKIFNYSYNYIKICNLLGIHNYKLQLDRFI